MIWIALIIPLVGAIVLFVGFRNKLTWWELFLPLAVCLVFTTIFKLTVEKVQTSDTEYWGDLGIRAEYYEPWSSWVSKRCSRQVACGTDSKGHTKYCTEYYDCSYCNDNGPRWTLVKSRGGSFSITRKKYDELTARWKAKPSFVELNRTIRHHFSCGEDGDKYVIEWNRQPITAEPTSETHSYENRIQATHTAFDFPEISVKDDSLYNLFEYPEVDGYNVSTLLGTEKLVWMFPAERDSLQRLVKYLNGDMGPRKQLRIWILTFVDKPSVAAKFQEAKWKGGNKNEMVICMGVNSKNRNIEWVSPFSWTPNRTLLVDLREDLMTTKKFSCKKIYGVLQTNLESFERKHFREFSYIEVDPPIWAIIVIFIITILATVGTCYWAVVNDNVADKHKPWKSVQRTYRY